MNKTFLSYPLFKEIRYFSPAVILYISSASTTFFSFTRTRVIKLYTKRAKVVMIALQPREYSLLSRKLMPLLIPDLMNGERSFVDVSDDIICRILAKYYSNFHTLVKAIFLSNPAQLNG